MKDDLSFVWHINAGQQVEHCGLARPVRTDDGHDLARHYLKVDFVHRYQASKEFLERANFQQRLHSVRLRHVCPPTRRAGKIHRSRTTVTIRLVNPSGAKIMMATRMTP